MDISADELRTKALRTTLSSYLPEVFLLAGLAIIAVYALYAFGLVNVDTLYFANAKAVRDAAESGSVVLGQLSTLEATRAWLEPAFFAGVSFILFGIAMSFAVSILALVKVRAASALQFLRAYRKR